MERVDYFPFRKRPFVSSVRWDDGLRGKFAFHPCRSGVDRTGDFLLSLPADPFPLLVPLCSPPGPVVLGWLPMPGENDSNEFSLPRVVAVSLSAAPRLVRPPAS